MNIIFLSENVMKMKENVRLGTDLSFLRVRQYFVSIVNLSDLNSLKTSSVSHYLPF